MSIEIRVPDIGDFDAVDVIEVLIAEGDAIEKEQSVLVLESDKASMEVPAESAGTVGKVHVKVGDQVKQGDLIAELEAADDNSADNDHNDKNHPDKANQDTETGSTQSSQTSDDSANAKARDDGADKAGQMIDIVIPDIGDFDQVDVIEVNVSEGDSVEIEDALITLESDKASMEVPAEQAGTIVTLSVKVGDKVAAGDVIGQLETTSEGAGATGDDKASADTEKAQPTRQKQSSADSQDSKPSAQDSAKAHEVASSPKPSTQAVEDKIDEEGFAKAHASPSVRKFARELGADLSKIKGSGRKGRIVEDDVKAYIKQALQSGASASTSSAGSGIPPIPTVDFSQFGEVETKKLSRINVLTGQAMSRNWLNIPHVTQHDLADITELEAFRKSLKPEAEKQGVRVTLLAFLMKAVVAGMKELPRFNSSLAADGQSLILKKYYNVGIAVDTPNGLVVPVIKEVDKKGIYELSSDLMELSKKARDGKLSPKDMSGGSMTISSLGGIGGHYFTPIVNAPEVAILGVSRSTMQPVWNGKEFEPRLMLPLSLSYDHRVIDGADGARMIVYLTKILADMKRAIL